MSIALITHSLHHIQPLAYRAILWDIHANWEQTLTGFRWRMNHCAVQELRPRPDLPQDEISQHCACRRGPCAGGLGGLAMCANGRFPAR